MRHQLDQRLRRRFRHLVRAALIATLAVLPSTAGADDGAPESNVSFSRDVQPVLARHCFACHGPDEEQRATEMRLDVRESALEADAFVPGRPKDSELVRRIMSDDEFVRMPPPDSGTTLTDAERNLLRNWIADGARYERHWAFVPLRRPDVPKLANDDWSRNDIDRFVLARLRKEGLTPAPTADRSTLVRRVYLDLIGLPPTPQEADAFVNDSDPLAYEKLVDRLLASAHYGEHWARRWLDLARYSDTNGYEKDRPRSIWPYRDWVIDALNRDMPFDQFTIEQIAGDMLPDATLDQRIATGFHRNTMLNEEGGIDPLEYRFYAMVDRVATTGTVWMGLTTGCAQCHSHKYDPITQTDYYSLFALLNNADEPDLTVPQKSLAQRRDEIQARIAELESQLIDQFPPAEGDGPLAKRRRRNFQQEFTEWLETMRDEVSDWQVLRPSDMETNLPRLELLDDGSILSTGDITKRDVFRLTFPLDSFEAPVTALRLEALPDERLPAHGPGRAYYEGRKGDFFLSEVTARRNDEPLAFESASHSYGKISIGSGTAEAGNVIDGDGSTGWSTAQREGEAHQLVLVLAQPLEPTGTVQLKLLFERHFAASLGRFRISATSSSRTPQALEMPVEIEALLAADPAELDAEDRERLQAYFLRTTPELAEARKPIDALRARLPEFPTTMVFEERPIDNPRPTFLHHRGEYLSPRDRVTPAVPAIFREDAQRGPRNRLEFARWLVSDENPLVARVTVNRAWAAFFGRGFVRTTEDLGTQSEPPAHPELLDWLASEFVARGWSLKSLHRLIVTSATYRQDSRVTSELLRRDPENRLLARGPRYRVNAEVVRDIMLKASGLLSTEIGGPSVYPPQPASVTALAYGNTAWNVSQGPDRYRRSLYTFSKRTAPFAAYAVFDAPTGENCVARRDRSNTPLQALTLLNDAMFLEMAQALARRAVTGDEGKSKPQSAEAIARRIFRRLLTREPTADELTALVNFQQSQTERLTRGELDAQAIAGDKSADPQLAAWVMVTRAVMNLDEVITKQ